MSLKIKYKIFWHFENKRKCRYNIIYYYTTMTTVIDEIKSDRYKS